MDCSRALVEYLEGLKIAKETGDMELAAKCCFMAAKCEQDNYYLLGKRDIALKNLSYRTCFRIMKKDYSTTEFYRDALKECGYLSDFVNKY